MKNGYNISIISIIVIIIILVAFISEPKSTIIIIGWSNQSLIDIMQDHCI